jgi:DNA-directed RNA polymerase subunit E'/Rpb7
MEHTVLFEDQVSFSPDDLSKQIRSIDEILLNKVKSKLENKCSRHGFVIKDTLKLISRSLGKASNGRFIGDFIYYVQTQGTVLNPPDGIIIEGEVIRKNKMGIYINYKDAVRVIIPRDLHIGNAAFDNVEVGSTIRVEIKKSRFQVNDESILSVGTFVESMNAAETEEEEQDDILLEDE